MTRSQRALQIWQLLVCAAYERRTLTYGLVAERLGMGGAGVLARFLGLIMRLCEARGYPPLTVLVVNQVTGLPGKGLSTIEEVNRDREAVFNFKWFELEPPESADFERHARR